jgi:tRNA dimethylallyltransferase
MMSASISINPDKVLVLTGPTAGGKSALALDLAERHGGTIINADASQLYADLAIVTARPGADDLARVPHRLYGVRDGADPASAADWLALAHAAIAQARGAGRLPIIVGGTGLYISTLVHGIAPVPAIDPEIRAAVRGMDTAALAAALHREDPQMAARLRPSDTQRLARALEVIRSSGQSLAAWQQQRTGGLVANAVQGLVVDRPRSVLNARAALRLQAMLAAGALAEISTLLARQLADDLPIMKALAVPQLAAHLRGELGLAEAVASAVHVTCQYQKRQQTWARTQWPGWQRMELADKG